MRVLLAIGRALGISSRPVRRLSVLPLLTLLAAAPAFAQTLTRGPLIQNPDRDATKATFVWWTNVAGNSTVEYGLTPALGQSVTIPQAGSCDVGSAGTWHTVTVSGLTPDTVYYYRLLTNGVQVGSATYFTTLEAPGVDTDFFFTVIGDWGQGTTGEAQLAALQNAADPPIILTVGDNSYTFGSQSDLDSKALAYYSAILPRTFFFPALGNHDVFLTGVSGYANSAYAKTFVLPAMGPRSPSDIIRSTRARRTSPSSTPTVAATPRRPPGCRTTSPPAPPPGSSSSCTTPPTPAPAAARRSAAT